MQMRRDPMQMMGRAPEKYLKQTEHALGRGRIPVRMLTTTSEQMPMLRRITVYAVSVTYAQPDPRPT